MTPSSRSFRFALLLSATATAAVTHQPLPLAGQQASTPVVAAEIDEQIRSRIERNGATASVIAVGSERLHAALELPRFYERRGFQPAWLDATGPEALADSLIEAVAQADREGLRPDDYHLPRIRTLAAELQTARESEGPLSAGRLADLDLLLTDAFLVYGSHLIAGRVDPVTMHPEWTATRREADLSTVLESALSSGRVGSALESLLPEHPEYFRLRSMLERYREITRQGGLPEIPGRPLHPGRTDPAVPLLREWVRLTGDLPSASGKPSDSTLFDPPLEAALRQVQERHGLATTGVVTLETSTVMNAPLEERVRTLELNMERWRWLPKDLGDRHIRVNIAAFTVKVFEGDSEAFTSRVMVGARYRKTPIFSDRMSYLVLNPTWTIPPGILEQDKLPLIRKDPGYLRANRIRVLDPSGVEVDPGSVDWSKVTGRTSYRLRMDPGPDNPLGQVKFMFPNAYSIYLHDTPSRDLFDRSRRDFSSGCIRVERPLELAAYLLKDDLRWTREGIDAALRSPGEQTIPLRRPVPVHLLYWTARADQNGIVHFHEDVYDRDAALDEALRQSPPSIMAATAALP